MSVAVGTKFVSLKPRWSASLIVRCAILLAGVATITTTASAAETYVVPVFARFFSGATATWESAVIVTNPHAEPTTLTITELFPTIAVPCAPCPSVKQRLIPAHSSVSVADGGVSADSQALMLGAFALTSGKSVVVNSWVVGTGAGIRKTQVVPVFEEFIPGSLKAWIPRAFSNLNAETINLFVVNPSASPLRVQYGIGLPSFAVMRDELVVAPKSTGIFRITNEPITLGAGVDGIPLVLIADGQFAALSSDGEIVRMPVVERTNEP